MGQTVLADRYIAAGVDLLGTLDEQQFPVTLAFWKFDPIAAEWRLVVVTPEVRKHGNTASSREIRSIISSADLDGALVLSGVLLMDADDRAVSRLQALTHRQETDSVGVQFDQEILEPGLTGMGLVYQMAAVRFEREVAASLRRVAPADTVIQSRIVSEGRLFDLLSYHDDIAIAVGALAVNNPLPAAAVHQFLRVPQLPGTKMIIVSRSGFTAAARGTVGPHARDIGLVQWESPADDIQLGAALQNLIHPPGRAVNE